MQIGIERHFALINSLIYFCRSLFSSFPKMLSSFTTEDNDLSSVKSFTVGCKLSGKS